MTKRNLARLAVIALAIVTIVPMGATAAHADASIDGAGSTWSQIAIDQWRADVARQGLSINYQGVGSTSGPVFYYQDPTDFRVSEIPFPSRHRAASGSIIPHPLNPTPHPPSPHHPTVPSSTTLLHHL